MIKLTHIEYHLVYILYWMIIIGTSVNANFSFSSSSNHEQRKWMSIDLFTVIFKGLSAIPRNAQETSPFTQSYDLIVDGVTDSLQRLEVGGYSYSIERQF